MPFPIGMLEWEPGVQGARRARIVTLSTDGNDETTNQSNYGSIRWNAFDSVDLGGTVWQAYAFWNDDASPHLVLGVRNTVAGAWTEYVYDGVAETPEIARGAVDNHNSISIAFDSDGYLHISYDHHGDPLNYRRTSTAINSYSGTLTNELSMLGTNEAEVSYPTFFRSPTGILYIMFRDGESGNGNLYMYQYATSGQTWAGVAGTTAGKLIDGVGSTGGQSPYWHGPPRFTANWDGAGTGFMWIIWSWRDTTDSESEHDVSAMRWNGTNWSQADGTAQTIPATLSNVDIIDPIGQNNTLASFNSMVIDSSGNPHAFHTYDDAADSDRSKIWHVYWDGAAWDGPTAITPSSATAEYGFNSVDAVIDADDTIRVVVCHHETDQRGVCAWVSDPSDWTTWTLEVLTAQDTFYVEGSVTTTTMTGQHDRYQWAENGVYRMMVPLKGYWNATEDDFTEWSGYTEATADAPASVVTNAVLKIAIDSSHADFWAAVDADGDDIRVSDGNGQQFPRDLVEWNYAGEYALISFMYFGDLSTAPTIRVYAGNGGAAAPGDDDTFGRHNVYPDDLYGYWPTGGTTDRTGWNNDLTMTGSPSATANTGPMGETTTDFDGSTQYGLTSTKFPTNVPLTLIANVKSDSATVNQTLISVANGAATGTYWQIAALGAVASDPVRATARSGGGTPGDADKIGYAVDTWHHVGGRLISNASRYALLDGVAGSENTTATTPLASLTRVGVGVLARSALDGKTDGEIGNVQLWAINLSADQIAYDSAQNNQTTFWNGWTWTSQGGGGGARRRRILMRSA